MKLTNLRRALGALALALVAFPAATPLAAQPAAAAAPDVLTNETVLKLLAAGLPEQAIIAKIRVSKTQFDTSTDRLIELKSKGVSGGILAAMLEPTPTVVVPVELSDDSVDINAPHYPGVYLSAANEKKLTRILASQSDQAKTGGIFGYALTMGIASVSIKAAIPGRTAKIQTTDGSPVFYFFFDESIPRALQGGGSSVWMSGNGGITSAPTELSLVRFNQKSGAREAQVGSLNIAGAKTGVMDHDRIAFESEQVRPGVFRVTPSGDLKPGEYGFIQTLNSGNGGRTGAMSARVFDFGVAR